MITRIQVIIADDHPIVHDGLCAILAADSQVRVVGWQPPLFLHLCQAVLRYRI